MKPAALLVLIWSLLEAPRDVGFLLEGQAGLTLGIALKLTTGALAAVGVWRGWLVGYGCLVGWCLQGGLMSVGEWLGRGPNLTGAASLLVRGALLVWFVDQRILRKEAPVR